jgi:hypothetical protein
MRIRDEDQLIEIWRGGAVTALRMDPAKLRERSVSFEASIRRRNLRDQLCFALVAVLCACGLFMDGVTLRAGSALMLGWAFFSMYTLHRFGVATGAPAGSDAQTLVAQHGRQLERQRDIALSWPWGAGLAIPGFTLMTLGLGFGSRIRNWEYSATMIGAFLFLYAAVVIYGKVRAAQWQREIDALRAMSDPPA